MCQLNAVQWPIHVPIKCYLEGRSYANLRYSAGHSCANN